MTVARGQKATSKTPGRARGIVKLRAGKRGSETIATDDQHSPIGQEGGRVPRARSIRLAVMLQVSLTGSYNSTLVVTPLLSSPPATRTSAFCTNVAVCVVRASVRFALVDQRPVDGSKTSTLERKAPEAPVPPATMTMPLFNRVAVWPKRPMDRLPVLLNVSLAGSNSSATTEGTLLLSSPPRSEPDHSPISWLVLMPAGDEVTGAHPDAGRGIVYFRTRKNVGVIVNAASDQDPATLQPSDGVLGASDSKTSRATPRPICRVIKLGARNRSGVRAAGDNHSPVKQQLRSMVEAWGRKMAVTLKTPDPPAHCSTGARAKSRIAPRLDGKRVKRRGGLLMIPLPCR